MIRRQPRSPLFPYTPLSRSDDVLRASLDRLTTRALLWGDDVLRAPDPVRRGVRYPAGLGRRAAELRLQLPADLATAVAELDRKSTRLNSSHANISYAVFCLK